MTSYRITYVGPASLAVRTATLLADAQGVELTSSEHPQRGDGEGDRVLLAMTVEATTEAVTAAVRQITERLPADANVTVEEDPGR